MAILWYTKRLLALGMALCAVTACAGRAGQTGTESPRITAETLPPSAPPIGPHGAVADEHAIGLKPHRWTRYDTLDGNALRLHYTITGSPQCNVLGRVEIAESPDTVTLTLHIGRWPTASCAAKLLKAADLFTEIELPTPLGSRSAKDGSA